MTGFNHVLTGGLIGALVPLPIAIPLALASHFVMDALPHYGIPHNQRNKSRFYKYFVITDTLMTISLAVFAIYSGHHFAMIIGGIMATLPDYWWVIHVIRTRSFRMDFKGNKFTRWHSRIQKWERPWGLWIELPLSVVLFYVVMFRLW